MALEGTLKDVGLSDIFQLIHLQKKTGILTIFRVKEVVTVSFDKGLVVFADEFQRSEQERLGAVLLKAKLITTQQLLKAVEMQKQTLQKLGHILVANDFLSQEQLKRALQMQVRETIFKLFRWEDGQFKFSQEPVAYDAGLYLPMPTDVLVMEGVRRIDEWPLIKKKIPGLDVIFDRSEEAEQRIGEAAAETAGQDLDDILSIVDAGGLGKPSEEESSGFKLSSSERVIFSLVDGQRTVQELVDEGRIGEFDTCKSLYSLLSLGLIRKVGEAAAPAEDKRKAVPRAKVLRKAALAASALAAVGLIMAANPLSLPRVWPAGLGVWQKLGAMGDELRRERIKFALLCYYLERKAYPSGLNELVQVHLLEPGDIMDHQGEEFNYLREQNGYSLRLGADFDQEGR